MKVWFNDKGHWCFEFDREDQSETIRLIMLIAHGVSYYREQRDKNPDDDIWARAHISAELFDEMIGETFIRQNYTQEHPTIDSPYEFDAEWAKKAYTESVWARDQKTFTPKQIQMLKDLDLEDVL